MQPRTDFYTASPDALKAMMALETAVSKLPLEKTLIELVKLRASQINGCAHCIDMHSRDLRKTMSIDKITLVPVWDEVHHLFSDQERAALENFVQGLPAARRQLPQPLRGLEHLDAGGLLAGGAQEPAVAVVEVGVARRLAHAEEGLLRQPSNERHGCRGQAADGRAPLRGAVGAG